MEKGSRSNGIVTLEVRRLKVPNADDDDTFLRMEGAPSVHPYTVLDSFDVPADIAMHVCDETRGAVRKALLGIFAAVYHGHKLCPTATTGDTVADGLIPSMMRLGIKLRKSKK